MKLLVWTSVVVACAVAASAQPHLATVENVTEQFIKFARREQSGDDLATFDKMVKMLSMPTYIYRTALEEYSQPRQTLICVLCRATVATVIDMRKSGHTEESIASVLSDLCTLLEITTGRICEGAVGLNLPIILYIIDNQAAAQEKVFCGLFFQSTSSQACPLDDGRFDFSIDIPKPSDEVKKYAGDNRQLKIIHLTDAHIDPEYEPHGVGNCNEPVCCRYGQIPEEGYRYKTISNDDILAKSLLVHGDEVLIDLIYADEVASEKDSGRRRLELEATRNANQLPAGYWGDYRDCDTPLWAFEDIIEHAAENNDDADFVYYTGDTVDHGVWETTHELCEDSITFTTDKIADAFPNANIFHILGNHESQPTNQFAPHQVTSGNLTTKWLYNLVADQWSKWLPIDAQNTIKKGGYYTVVPRQGFRIIALNTNVAYRFNWWLVFDPVDPDDQLQWLSDTLFEAERNGEIVHILSHIPPGTRDIYHTWSREYSRIYERFSHIIAAEFNGHTHNDEFKVFYSKDDPTVATNVAWNGAAMTSYSKYNVNYKVLDIDGITYEALDIDTWTYNLTLANETPQRRPQWYKLYSFKEAYGVNSLKPRELDNLVRRMASSNERHLLHKYIRYWGSEGDLYLEGECDEDCELQHLCKMVTTELWDNRNCDEITSLYHSEN